MKKDSFFVSMMAEGGKVSHKRWISVTISAVLAWTIIYTCVNTPALRQDIIHATMIFVLIMSGVATVAQVVSLVRGGNQNTSEPTKPTDNGTNQ